MLKKYKYHILLILFLLVVTLFISIFVSKLVLVPVSIDKKGSVEQKEEFNTNFFEKYLSDDIALLEKFPFTNEYLKQYTNYSFNVENVPLQIVLVDASGFGSTMELYEKMYLSNDATGNVIKRSEITSNGRKIDMVLTNLAVGPITYMLSGGVIEDDKGYFFRIYIDRGDLYGISEEDFSSIFSFDHKRSPSKALAIINEIIDEDIPQSDFKSFDDSQIINNPTLDARRRYGDAMPSSF